MLFFFLGGNNNRTSVELTQKTSLELSSIPKQADLDILLGFLISSSSIGA